MPQTKNKSWGGARAGAGRKRNKLLAPHASRELKKLCPVLITLVCRSQAPSLQESPVFEAFHRGAQRARRHGLRIIEYAAFEKKIFLICEFKNRKDLESSLKSLCTTLAIALKKLIKDKNGIPHKGPIFLGRYRMEVLDSPATVIEAQTRILPIDPSDYPYSSLLCMSRLKAHALFSRFPVSQSLREENLRQNESDQQRAENIFKFLDIVEKDPRFEIHKKEAISTTASPQFTLTQSGWLRQSSPSNF